MKTVFIINPKAGRGNKIKELIAKVKAAAIDLKVDASVYLTKAVGDAEVFVKEYCKKHGKARFIACGGDGTLSEVLNGAIDCADAEIGVIPIGTGNDFCRNFDVYDFYDIASQIFGESEKCDAIKYTTVLNGIEKKGYCVNMFNIGFDCNVADTTGNIKKSKILSGPFAYYASIFINLVRKKGTNVKIELDGETVHNGKILLTSVANGSFCGGGIKSNPLASVKDGFININIIKNISLFKFLYLLPYYMKGTFLSLKDIDKIILSKKCRKVCVTPYEKKFKFCNDGEIEKASKTEFEIVHNAFNFVIPKVVQRVLK